MDKVRQHHWGLIVYLIAFAAVVVPLETAAALERPRNIVCHSSGVDVNQVRITWEHPPEAIDSYSVERSVNGGLVFTFLDTAQDAEFYDTFAGAEAVHYCVYSQYGGEQSGVCSKCTRPKVFETGSFMVFYRPESEDNYQCPAMTVYGTPRTMCASEGKASNVAGWLEGSRSSLMALGFADPAKYGGEPPLPIDLVWVPGDGGGLAEIDGFGDSRESGIMLTPDFLNSSDDLFVDGKIVTLHELFHQQQFTYGGIGTTDDAWVWEGQARSVQDKLCLDAGASPAEEASETCDSLDSESAGRNSYYGAVEEYFYNAQYNLLSFTDEAALFWTYVTEQFGTIEDEPQLGMDFLLRFWEKAQENEGTLGDGLSTLDRVLEALNPSQSFSDVFKDFAVANCVKDLNGSLVSIPPEYRYKDEPLPPGLCVGSGSGVDLSFEEKSESGSVSPWSARYYQLYPAPELPIFTVEFTQQAGASNLLYYKLLAVDENDNLLLLDDGRETNESFVRTLENNEYARVVIVAAGLQNETNIDYTFRGAQQPELEILEPLDIDPVVVDELGAPESIWIHALVHDDETPLDGIAPDDFRIAIDSQEMELLQVIDTKGVGEYRIQVNIQAWNADSSDCSDLTVSFGPLEHTEEAAVCDASRVDRASSARRQQVLSERGMIPNREPVSHVIQVDPGAREASFVFKGVLATPSNGTLLGPPTGTPPARVSLVRPDGSSAGPPTLKDQSSSEWRIPAPAAGDWRLTVHPGAPCVVCTDGYVVETTFKSALTLDVFLGLALEDRPVGRPMPILASLADRAPIPGATVEAFIFDPRGGNYTLTLFDDGWHGDGEADDGLYGNTFYQTRFEGAYRVVVTAKGTARLAGDFLRRQRAGFRMAGARDRDRDGMPDWWEIRWGTDPGRRDANKDPDLDGLTNIEEYSAGTSPQDADTDDGGEDDGSEIDNLRDPRDPRDDRIVQPRARAWPRVGRVALHYKVNPESSVRVFRSDEDSRDFVLIGRDNRPTGEWIDDSVENDREYCYRVVVVGVDGVRSAPSNPTCTVPREDPIPPTGSIQIDNLRTGSRSVKLKLLASDNSLLDSRRRHPGEPPWPVDEAKTTGVRHMRISNNGGFVGARWEPFQSPRAWVLEPSGGLATVFVQYRDRAGNVSEVSHDTVAVADAPEVGQ